jgi:hypothetical protein
MTMASHHPFTGEILMKSIARRTIRRGLAVLFIGTILVCEANAQCGYFGRQNTTGRMQPQSWRDAPQFGPASFLLAQAEERSEGIVGFWKVKFVSKNSPGIPDGTLIDNGFAQWHSDGTEIMNSSRPPSTSSFCLGVWQKRGTVYKLNHFGLSYDPSGKFIGPARVREVVALDEDGKHYAGFFTIDQYDPAGNRLAHIEGQITARRITVNTSIKGVL